MIYGWLDALRKEDLTMNNNYPWLGTTACILGLAAALLYFPGIAAVTMLGMRGDAAALALSRSLTRRSFGTPGSSN